MPKHKLHVWLILSLIVMLCREHAYWGSVEALRWLRQ